MQNYRTIIVKQLAKILNIDYQTIKITQPKDFQHGDLTTNIAMIFAKQNHKNPLTIANKIVPTLQDFNFIKQVEIVGYGFINIHLHDHILMEIIARLKPDKVLKIVNSERILVDYSSPNVGKPMHAGHFRTTMIGDAMVKILRRAGHTVVGLNYLGDWGTQFGKLIYALKNWTDWTQENPLKISSRSKLEQNTIEELLKLYIYFHEEEAKDPDLKNRAQLELVKLENSDEQNLAIWQFCVAATIKQLKVDYQKLNIIFDEYSGESHYIKTAKKLILKLQDQGIATISQGAVVIELPENIAKHPAILQSSNGSTIYLSRDLSALYHRREQGFTQIVYTVGTDQVAHFKQLFYLAEKLDIYSAQKLKHLACGLISLPEGKMSTRSGRTISFQNIITEANIKTRELLQTRGVKMTDKELEKLTKIIALGAIKYAALNQTPHQNTTFTWEKALMLEGNSAPYLQYSAVRALNIINKNSMKNDEKADISTKQKLSSLSIYERKLSLELINYQSVILKAAEEYKPNLIANYLYELAKTFHSFYANCPVLKSSQDQKQQRLILSKLTYMTITDGLALLGIETPKQM